MLVNIGNPTLAPLTHAMPVLHIDPLALSINAGYAVPGKEGGASDFYGLSTGFYGRNDNLRLHGVAAHLWGSSFHDVYGAQISGLSSVAEHVRGFQFGLMEAIAKEVRGVQMAYVNAFTKVLYGYQHSEMLGSISEKGFGFQYSALGSFDGEFTGLRIAWLGSYAEKMNGLLISPLYSSVSSSNGKSLHLGLLNFIKGKDGFNFSPFLGFKWRAN